MIGAWETDGVGAIGGLTIGLSGMIGVTLATGSGASAAGLLLAEGKVFGAGWDIAALTAGILRSRMTGRAAGET